MPYVAGPFDQAHLYLQWGGKLPGNEQWSCGLRIKSLSGAIATPTDQNAMITGMKTAIQAFHVRAGSFIGSSALLSFVKLNTITTAGVYGVDTTTQQVVADVAGGGGSTIIPNQVALAVTTETGFSRGAAHRGRFYLPMPSMAVQSDGTILSADATSVKTSCGTLLTALNAVNANFKVAIFSRKSGAPANRQVTGFSVGRVLDTQRRRRRSLAELYV